MEIYICCIISTKEYTYVCVYCCMYVVTFTNYSNVQANFVTVRGHSKVILLSWQLSDCGFCH